MRKLAAALLIVHFSSACDKDERAKELAGNVAGDSGAVATVDAAVPDAATKPADAGTPAMPERPIPRPQTTVSSGMSTDIQMKAITYMMAMRTPHADDPGADPKFAEELATKLKPIVLSADKGADKAKFNRVDVVANGRQIDLLLAQGCDAQLPKNVIVSRANVPLATLLAHGVLVVRCNDQHYQCLQSIRDPEDVLCTTAPRHK